MIIMVIYFVSENAYYCFLFSFYILGIAFGLVDLSIDTFRRDSSLNVIASMLLSLVYDISSCLIAVFIAYYGGRGNKLKWITVSSILIGFGSLLFAFPYLSNENYQSYGETEGKILKDTYYYLFKPLVLGT